MSLARCSHMHARLHARHGLAPPAHKSHKKATYPHHSKPAPLPHGLGMLESGTPQYHEATNIAPVLIMKAMRKLTSLLSSKSHPLSATRLGRSLPSLDRRCLSLGSYLFLATAGRLSASSATADDLAAAASLPVSVCRTAPLPSPESRAALTSARFSVFSSGLAAGGETSTRKPPSPSTILPVRTSRTDRWNRPPRKESWRLPRAPHMVRPNLRIRFWSAVQGAPPPGVPSVAVLQRGRNLIEVVTMIMEPSRPAAKPPTVTPPLVPRGTFRSVGDVMRRGVCDDSMPSSDEKVSAATHA